MNTLQTVFEQQKRHFASGVTRSYEWRVERDFNVVANSYSKGTALITGSLHASSSPRSAAGCRRQSTASSQSTGRLS